MGNFFDSLFSKKKETRSAEVTVSSSKSVIDQVLIPEPTRSLLWITNEDLSKWQGAGSISIQINVKLNSKNEVDVELEDLSNSYFSEPSLIWSRLAIKPNSLQYNEPIYYPTYAQLTPEGKYQYLKWLADISQPTNLSYVFLYFYGLERHLVAQDYDGAVDEIVRLVKYHPTESFIRYATNSLLAASFKRKRYDILERAPFLLEQETDLALAIRILRKTSLSADDVISLANTAGYTNKRYIKQQPALYKEQLEEAIKSHEQIGNILGQLKLDDFKTTRRAVFANMSFPDGVQNQKIRLILEDRRFQKAIFELLDTAHQATKEILKTQRAKSVQK